MGNEEAKTALGPKELNVDNDNEFIFETVDTQNRPLKLKIIKPKQKILQEADIVQRSAYSIALRRKIMSKAEAVAIVEENKAFTSTWEKKYADGLQSLTDAMEKYENAEDEAEKKLAAIELRICRNITAEMGAEQQGIFRNTA